MLVLGIPYSLVGVRTHELAIVRSEQTVEFVYCKNEGRGLKF